MSRDYTRAEILEIIEKGAESHGIVPEDFLRFAHIETGGKFDEKASRGTHGAKGLFQFVPITARQYGIAGSELDPVANTEAACRLYLDNRRSIVKSHEMNGRPYLSGLEEPSGFDMYMAHQQGVGGYRSIQAAISDGRFLRNDTRAHVLNNVGAKDFEAITGQEYESFIRMSDRDMALAFVGYWGCKYGAIRIPEKGIEPISESRRVRDQSAGYGDDGIVLRSAYDMTIAHDQVRYGFGKKDLSSGRIDCSGWIVEMVNATYAEINEKAGKKIFSQKDYYSSTNDAAASIVYKAEKNSGLMLEGRDVAKETLREGMIIGEDNGKKGWDKNRYKGIDHIVMVLRDPDSGELMVSQSRSGEGIEMLPLDDYLAHKRRGGVRLYASDPLSEARSLLLEKDQFNSRGLDDKAMGQEIRSDLMSTAQDLSLSKRVRELELRPMLCDPLHPDYSLFSQAYDGLKQLRGLGFSNESCFVNAAGSLVAQARTNGLKRLDHIVQSTHGSNLIGIQGRMDDPANRWIHVDKESAVVQPIQLSTIQADGVRQRQQADRQSGHEIQISLSR